MEKREGMIAASLGILILLVITTSGCLNGGDDISWKKFMTDYEDTDGDGEKDDFKSYDVGDTVTIRDKVIQSGGSMFKWEFTFDSYPDVKMVFHGDGSQVNTNERIEAKIKITTDTEEDGGEKETYVVEEIQYVD